MATVITVEATVGLFKRTKPADDGSLRGPNGQAGRRRETFRTSSTLNRGQVFSYYGNRSQTELNVGRETRATEPGQPLRKAPGRLYKLRTHAGWLMGFALILTAIIFQLQLSSTPRVVSLVSAQDSPYLRDTNVYRDAAAKLIDNSAANRNKLTIHASAISDSLRKQFPELDTATVSLPLIGDKVTIYVKPAEPALVLATPSDSFVIDQRGRALQVVQGDSQIANAAQIPTVTDQSSLSFALGKQALSRSTTAFISAVDRQYRALHITIQAMVLPVGTSELHVYPQGKPYFVKFNLHDADEDSARQQAGAFAAVNNYLAGKHIVPSQYIDVRLQGRVFYK